MSYVGLFIISLLVTCLAQAQKVEDDYEYEFDVEQVYTRAKSERIDIGEEISEVAWANEDLQKPRWALKETQKLDAITDGLVSCRSWYYVSYPMGELGTLRKYFTSSLIDAEGRSVIESSLMALKGARLYAMRLARFLKSEMSKKAEITFNYGLYQCFSQADQETPLLVKEHAERLSRYYFFKDQDAKQFPEMMSSQIISTLKSAYRP